MLWSSGEGEACNIFGICYNFDSKFRPQHVEHFSWPLVTNFDRIYTKEFVIGQSPDNTSPHIDITNSYFTEETSNNDIPYNDKYGTAILERGKYDIVIGIYDTGEGERPNPDGVSTIEYRYRVPDHSDWSIWYTGFDKSTSEPSIIYAADNNPTTENKIHFFKLI